MHQLGTDGTSHSKDRRVRVPKTAELVAGKLRREIVLGEFLEGDQLASELELMADFGVSRPTLREAFRILESEGLISVVRGAKGGARAHSPSFGIAARYTGWVLQFQKTSLAEVYATRVILEASCAGSLARMATPEDIAQLAAAVAAAHQAVEAYEPGTDSHLLVAMQLRVHQVVVELAGNKSLNVLASMVDAILDRADAQYAEMTQSDEGVIDLWRLASSSQAKLLRFIEKGDDVGAERHWRVYLQAAADQVLKGLGSRSVIEIME